MSSPTPGPHVLYEVSLDVEPAIADAFAAWLAPHIDAMLDLAGFLSAAWWREDAPTPPTRGVRWVVQYRLASPDALERYLREDAPRMRQDGLDRFEGRFDAERRILHLVDARP